MSYSFTAFGDAKLFMDLENLNQYNKKLFKKFFGIYIKSRRESLGISLEDLTKSMSLKDTKTLKLIEAGTKPITQEELDLFCYYLSLDPQELLNIGKITQVQNIIDVYREIDELYPK